MRNCDHTAISHNVDLLHLHVTQGDILTSVTETAKIVEIATCINTTYTTQISARVPGLALFISQNGSFFCQDSEQNC